MSAALSLEERERFAYMAGTAITINADEVDDLLAAQGFMEAALDFSGIYTPEDLTKRLTEDVKEAFEEGKAEGIGTDAAALIAEATAEAARVKAAYTDLLGNFQVFAGWLADGTLKLAPARKQKAELLRRYLVNKRTP